MGISSYLNTICIETNLKEEENYNYDYIYFGLSNKEIKDKKIIYKNSKYQHKGVNTTLEGLKRFIKDYNMEKHIKYYSKIPVSKFKIDSSILHDKEYDMIAVKIPFEINITNIEKL